MTTSYLPDYDHPSQDEDMEDNTSTANLHPDSLEAQSSSPSMEYTHNHLNNHLNTTQPRSHSCSPNHTNAPFGNSSTLPTSLTTSPSRLMSNNIGHKRKNPKSSVEKIIKLTPTCYLKPKCFFVAWNSVITMVFTGWPEPIDTMKRELAQHCTLCKELSGSKFPSVTLACVKDGIEITPRRLSKIRRLCLQNPVPKDWVLCLDSLSVCLWENRCQESIIYEKIIPLKKNHKFLGSPRPLLLNLEEEDDSPYLRSANRTSHYRSLVIGSSIVHRLIHIPKFITDFQAKLPSDIFDVFTKESMHVTIRSLC